MKCSKTRAQRTAKILLETQSVLFRTNKPFTLTSGKKSPVYVDCRRIISFPKQRKMLLQMAIEMLQAAGVIDHIDVIAGGESAGIAYAAFLAHKLVKPMVYIRKKIKKCGRNAPIEGVITKNDTVLLVEDMITDGGSKKHFLKSIRDAGAHCNHCFVFFSYGVFPDHLRQFEKQNAIKIHSLATWQHILDYADTKNIMADLGVVKSFLENPQQWQQTYDTQTYNKNA